MTPTTTTRAQVALLEEKVEEVRRLLVDHLAVCPNATAADIERARSWTPLA